eukprot:12695099-Ditylum_brightwellii.AAC.1
MATGYNPSGAAGTQRRDNTFNENDFSTFTKGCCNRKRRPHTTLPCPQRSLGKTYARHTPFCCPAWLSQHIR